MEKVVGENYPTDLSEKQWAKIEPFFVGMRKCKFEKRKLVNAVLYLEKTGCQWRNLLHDFPNRKTVYSFFMRRTFACLNNSRRLSKDYEISTYVYEDTFLEKTTPIINTVLLHSDGSSSVTSLFNRLS